MIMIIIEVQTAVQCSKKTNAGKKDKGNFLHSGEMQLSLQWMVTGVRKDKERTEVFVMHCREVNVGSQKVLKSIFKLLSF